MIRISGRNLDPKKQLKFAISPVKGIGKNNVKDLLQTVFTKAEAEGILPEKIDNFASFCKLTLGELDEKVIVLIRNTIDSNFLVEDNLRRKNNNDINRLVEIGSWRGIRHKSGLSVRGQHTRRNVRTRRRTKRAA